MLKKGQKVKYHKIVRADGSVSGTIETVLTSEPWMLGSREWVVNVKGVSGGVSLRHIEIIPSKSKADIREETPLSVTSTDNAIYEVIEDCRVKIYDSAEMNGHRNTWWTLEYGVFVVGDRLRLLQCDDDEKDNVYRVGEENKFVRIPDSKMKHISGDIGIKAD